MNNINIIKSSKLKVQSRILRRKLFAFFLSFALLTVTLHFALLTFNLSKVNAAAGIYEKINFQGKLVNSDGTNVADNNYSVTFTLYDASSAGTNLWDEVQTVSTVNGIFQVSLGTVDSTLSNVDFNSDSLYLGIKVGADSEMTPRVRFSAVPYAFNAKKVSGLTVTQTTGTFTLANSKTLTVNNTLSFSGTDSTTMTFPSSTTTIAGLSIAQTFTAAQTVQSNSASALTVGANGATNPVLQIDASTGSVATGLKITGAATGGTTGLTVIDSGSNANLSINAKGSGTVSINGTATGGITLGAITTLASGKALIITGGAGDPTATNGTVWYDTTAGKFKIVEGGSVKTVCNTTDAGCGTGGGGGGTDRWQVNNGVLSPGNQTLDFAIGGTSTGSAKFVFGGINAGTPTATFSGDLIINNRPNTSAGDVQKWTKITGTAGTIGGGATTAIASISASVVYNGSLYVGTNKADSAEIYRYNGDALGTWTKISGTAGTVGDNATTLIDMISSMTVYNGYLYAGTTEPDKGEVYRYNGGSSWTQINVTNTAGKFVTTTGIDGVSTMAVFGGRLLIGTREVTKAEIYMYNGGTTWIAVNGTAGTFVATNSIGMDMITQMVVVNNQLIIGTLKAGDADVLRWNGIAGGSPFFALNLASATGSYLIDNAAQTGTNEITAMTVWAGKLIVAIRRAANQADILMYQEPPGGAAPINSWTRLNSAAGTIGTASIDSVTALTVYNGRLYAGTNEPNGAEIYRYDEGKSWTRVSQNTVGTIAAGGTGSIDTISTLLPYNNNLFAGTLEGTSAEGYMYSSSIDQSYALKFHAGTSQAAGEQNSQQNLASIFFVASLSANLNNKQGSTGSFVFTHSITTNNGSYDVAEDYPTRDDTIEPGDLVSIDQNERGFVKKSEGAYDYGVIGVYSESPALRLSQDDGLITGGRAIPIALAGRVPVKVSTENGSIKNGDYLTASSVNGVAMKATKAGIIIGQAMESYNSEGVGKITVFIKSNSYNGTTAALFANIDMNSPQFEEDVLSKLASGSHVDGFTSEISTDRLVAGLEIITPKIVTNELIAKRIKADNIEGLGSMVAGIMQSSSQSASVGIESRTDIIESIVSTASGELSLTGLSVDGLATVSANLRVKNNTLVEGILTVIDTITGKDLIINGLATFFGDVIFKGNVVFGGHPVFGKDTAGIATVKKDSDRVEVVFAKEYDHTPVISASISVDDKDSSDIEQDILKNNSSYIITKRSTKGFTILLVKPATQDITFSWIALSSDGSLVFENKEGGGGP